MVYLLAQERNHLEVCSLLMQGLDQTLFTDVNRDAELLIVLGDDERIYI